MEGSVVLAGETQSATQPVDVRIVEDISISRLTKEELFPLCAPGMGKRLKQPYVLLMFTKSMSI